LDSAQTSKKKMARLRKEIAMLSNSLPDGIFVRVDENRFDFIKVMIVGPYGTPYENGCFFFDLFLPDNYPTANPMMKFMTTGAGRFRFNPNLYTDGKICISLLGTWSGPGWDPVTSTILQLLVSIQALVFVDYPLENEPGYEGQALQPDSLAYNRGIHVATTEYAMLWHLTQPVSPCFDEAIRGHLYCLRERLPSQFSTWDTVDANASNYCGYFAWEGNVGDKDTVRNDLLKQLTDMKNPAVL